MLDPGATIDDLLRRALGEVWEVRLRLDALERDLTDLDAYGEAQERFEALGGWALEARLDEARRRLGIEHLDRAARGSAALSGGEAARCLLASVLLGEPTVLLLDEPTNHLDADGRAWLAEWLAGFTGTLLTVSHDRDFLDATVDRVLRALAGGIEAYEGGYTAYREERERRRERLALLVEAQDKRRRRLEADIAMTARQAQYTERKASRDGRGRAAAQALRGEGGEEVQGARAPAASARWPPRLGARCRATRRRSRCACRTPRTGRRLVAAVRDVAVDGVFADASFTLHGGDRVALVGPNGAGKSTLLHLLSGAVEPDAARSTCAAPCACSRRRPRGCPPSAACSTGSASRPRCPRTRRARCSPTTGSASRRSRRPLGRLSPGERARVHVAAMVAAGAELILLDEPTNHLDFDTLEVIEAALRAYRGTLVVASHDRALHEAIGCDRVIEVRDGGSGYA